MISPEASVSSILVTCGDKAGLQKHYLPALRSAGWDQAIEVLAPGDPLPSLVDFTGLLLSGGRDIHPRHWDPREAPHPAAEPHEERDALEIPIAREAWRLGLPILGICRGEQILNVALGGSLIQDISSRCRCAEDVHRSGSAEVPRVQHRVDLAPASRLAGLIGATSFGVNSRHHQAVDQLAPGLMAVGWSETGDRIIEAIEAADPFRWVFGVQWHPENLVNLQDETGLAARRLFEGFLAAAR
jgi:putative glutamine amidotransferase